MIRSLALKWIVTLLLTSLVGVVLVGLFAYRTTTSEYDRLRVERAQIAFIDSVTTYYQEHQGWFGLEDWLRETRMQPGTPGSILQPQLFALTDANGMIVAGVGPFHLDQHVTFQEIEQGIPIFLDGEQIGTALLATLPPQLDPREQAYLDSSNRALIIGAVGASSVALLLGIVLSRHFLRPLTELTTAITAMKHGDLNQQVQVHSQDELGALARTFNQMTAEIHRVNQLRKQMTADIAHDLRTPLMVISGYIEALRDGTFKPTPERFEAMHREALLLRRLVDDLRTLSLADAGELKLVYQMVCPRELLEQVRQSFEPLAVEQQVVLHVEADETLPNLPVDRERMAEVLANLVSNALRYTPAGGSVKLLAQKQDGCVQLIVSDNGSGIPEDKLPNIFERFYRIDESRHENSGGESGLGLAIAKSIVEAHHGTITAESVVGHGTTMVITLPQNNA